MAQIDWKFDQFNSDSAIYSTFGAREGSYYYVDSLGISGSNYNTFSVMTLGITGVTGVDILAISGGTIQFSNIFTQGGIAGAFCFANDTTFINNSNAYMAVINGYYCPDMRILELRKGNLESGGDILTSVMLTGGISGNWYDYKFEFYRQGAGTEVVLNIYENTNTFGSPSWTQRISYTDSSSIYSPGQVGMFRTVPYQFYVGKIIGTGSTGSVMGDGLTEATCNGVYRPIFKGNELWWVDRTSQVLRMARETEPNKWRVVNILGNVAGTTAAQGDGFQVFSTPPWNSGAIQNQILLVYNNKLYYFGDGSWVSDDGYVWEELTSPGDSNFPYSTTLSYGAGVVFNNKMWLISGYADSAYQNKVYSTADGINFTLESSSPFSEGRRYPQVTVYNNKIWVFGGYNASTTTLQDAYSSTDGASWSSLGSMSLGARRNAGCFTHNNKMWLITGFNGSTNVTTSSSSTDGTTWTTESSDIGFDARDSGYCYHDGYFYVVAGYRNTGGAVSTIWRSSDLISWSSVATGSFSVRYRNQATASFNGFIWTYGGTAETDMWRSAGGAFQQVKFYDPTALVYDDVRDCFYVLCYWGKRLYKVDATTYDATYIVGDGSTSFGDGTGTSAYIASNDLAIDSTCDNLLLADMDNHRIRKVTLPTYVVTTVVGTGTGSSSDGTGTGATTNGPWAITFDPTYSYAVVGEWYGNRIRKVTYPAYVVTTLAGNGTGTSVDGTGTSATVYRVSDLCFDGDANNIYFTEPSSGYIRVYDVKSAFVNTVLGDGTSTIFQAGDGKRSKLESPAGITRKNGNYYISSGKVMARQPKFPVEIFAGSGAAGGSDATGRNATFKNPTCLVLGSDGYIYASDYSGYILRKIHPITGVVTTVAGLYNTIGTADGTTGTSRLNGTYGLFAYGNYIYMSEYANKKVRRYDVNTTQLDTLYTDGSVFGRGIVTDGNYLFSAWSDYRIRKHDMDGTNTSIIAGTGSVGGTDNDGTSASLASINLGYVKNGYVYFPEGVGYTVRKMLLTSPYTVTTIAGLYNTANNTDGTLSNARFNYNSQIIWDEINQVWYISDSNNCKIRKMDDTNVSSFTWLANSTGASATGIGQLPETRIYSPHGMCLIGNYLYVAAYNSHCILRIVVDMNADDSMRDYVKIDAG